MLRVKLLHPDATVPTVAHPGSDLGYDLYALEEVVLHPLQVTKVRTGISIEFDRPWIGGIIEDRSSMALKGVHKFAGVIDPGYRGELIVLVCLITQSNWHSYVIKKGDKIAQLRPVTSHTGEDIRVVEELSVTERGAGGFGSTGK